MSGWQPVETAPDDTFVDVWCVDKRTTACKGWREADCRKRGRFWVKGKGTTRWFTGRRYRNEDGDLVYDPALTDFGSVVVTHWMPIPGGPDEDN